MSGEVGAGAGDDVQAAAVGDVVDDFHTRTLGAGANGHGLGGAQRIVDGGRIRPVGQRDADRQRARGVGRDRREIVEHLDTGIGDAGKGEPGGGGIELRPQLVGRLQRAVDAMPLRDGDSHAVVTLRQQAARQLDVERAGVARRRDRRLRDGARH